jgi:hypothetical protein
MGAQMSVAMKTPPGHVRLLRAPVLDPPFDDELTPSTYRPAPPPAPEPLPPVAIAGASPECHTAALKFLNLTLELLNGFRPPAQLRPLIAVPQAVDILDELARGLRLVTAMRRKRPGADNRVRRTQLRTCEPRPGAAEVAAVLNDGDRAWALAYRLERLPVAGWRCVALRIIL